MPAHREVILEFHHVGAYVKVSAIDTATLTEVSIVGDPAAGEAALKQAAIRKLDYVLKRKAEAGKARSGSPGSWWRGGPHRR
jgi:phage head maturation protease